MPRIHSTASNQAPRVNRPAPPLWSVARGAFAALLGLLAAAACDTEAPFARGSGDGAAGRADGGIADGAAPTDGGMLTDGRGDDGQPGEEDAGPAGDAALPSANCASGCHGSADSPAPPLSLAGTSDTSERGVGAHAAHLGAADWHAPLECGDCHSVPAAVDSAGHIDSELPAEVIFSDRLAKAEGAAPAWTGNTCADAYCHGATIIGGSNKEPTWTTVDGSQAACGTCHSLPPGGDHPEETNCAGCHSAVVDSSNQIIAPNLHIDGEVSVSGDAVHPDLWFQPTQHGPAFIADAASCAGSSCHGAADALAGGSGPSCDQCHSGWQTNCTFCHGGNDNQSGAPPSGVDGETQSSDPAVGAHSAHVAATATHAAYDCTQCHTKPANALSSGHIDPSPAEIALGPLAGASANYNAANHTCADVACHGDGQGGGSSVVWTGSLSGGCDACHSTSHSALSGAHDEHDNRRCSTCHECVVIHPQNEPPSISAPARHVNGSKDVCFSNNTSWDASTKRCTGGCHVGSGETWN